MITIKDETQRDKYSKIEWKLLLDLNIGDMFKFEPDGAPYMRLGLEQEYITVLVLGTGKIRNYSRKARVIPVDVTMTFTLPREGK